MTTRPPGWSLLTRRVSRQLAEDTARTVLGDLLEDFRTDRQRRGWMRASWTTWRDARSITRAYAARTAGPPWRGLDQDVRAAIRTCRRQPGLTATIVLALAFTVSANTSLFSIVDGLLFRPLPFRDAHELVALRLAPLSNATERMSIYRNLIVGIEASPLFASVTLVGGSGLFSSEAAEDLRLVPASVSPRFFEILGLPLAAGRDLRADDSDAAPPVPAIIGHDLWQRVFGSDPDVVGRVSQLAGASVLIVGIAPDTTTYPLGTNVWVPSAPPVSNNGLRLWQLGRLKPGVSVEQVRAQFPDLVVTPLREAIQPRDTRALVLLLGATALLLIVAWVQIGAVMLTRAVSRLPEVGVRLTLGASTRRLTRQYIVDGLLVTGVALGLAWLSTVPLTLLLISQLPVSMTRGQAIAPDWRTFAFAAAVSMIGAVLLSVAPALALRRSTPLGLISGGAAGTTRWTDRWRSLLLTGQVTCSTTLLIVAGLSVHSFSRASQIDVGFDTSHLWQIAVPSLTPRLAPEPRAAAVTARKAEVADVLAQIRALPFVTAAGAGGNSPFLASMSAAVYAPGRSERVPVDPKVFWVTRGYMDALQPRLQSGRLSDDLPPGTTAVDYVINSAFERDVSATPELLRGTLTMLSLTGRVVGVVDDISPIPGVADGARIFLPLGDRVPGVILVRTRPDAAAVDVALRAIVSPVWGETSTRRTGPVSDQLEERTAPWRARSVLFGLVAGSCIPLVAAGILSTLLASVRERSREIAVRVALGASVANVVGAVMKRTAWFTGLGLMGGAAGGVAIGGVMSGLLFGVSPADPLSLLGSALVVLSTTALAALVPARLAARVAPVDALRDR